MISVALPCCTTRPRSSTTIRVASRSASIGSWVTISVGPANVARCSRSSPCTSARVWTSSAASGSSSSSASGRLASARASATRWLCPPDSCRGRRRAYSRQVQPVQPLPRLARAPARRASRTSAARTRRCRRRAGAGTAGGPGTRRRSGAARAGRRRRRAGSSRTTSPIVMRPVVHREQPGDRAQHRGLAGAVRPEQRHHLTGRDGHRRLEPELAEVDGRGEVEAQRHADGTGRSHLSRSAASSTIATSMSSRLSATASSGSELNCW